MKEDKTIQKGLHWENGQFFIPEPVCYLCEEKINGQGWRAFDADSADGRWVMDLCKPCRTRRKKNKSL